MHSQKKYVVLTLTIIVVFVVVGGLLSDSYSSVKCFVVVLYKYIYIIYKARLHLPCRNTDLARLKISS